MKKITLTCPFTGLPFTALESVDGDLIVHNPITHEDMRIGCNRPSKRYLVDTRFFKPVEIVSQKDAPEILGVSRARVNAIIKENVIPHFTANGRIMFAKSDLDAYMENRSTGRPKKRSADDGTADHRGDR